MAAYKGPDSLRRRCTRSGGSLAAMPLYQSDQGNEVLYSIYCEEFLDQPRSY
jgi:hypothetical protein